MKTFFIFLILILTSGCAGLSAKHENALVGAAAGAAVGELAGASAGLTAVLGGTAGWAFSEEPCTYTSMTQDPDFTGGSYEPTEGSASVHCSMSGSPNQTPTFHVPSDVR